MRALRGTWRAVALDLDGTTLNSSHMLTARTVEAIKKIESPPFFGALWRRASRSCHVVMLLGASQLRMHQGLLVCPSAEVCPLPSGQSA